MADLRAGIIRLHEQGQKAREIARLLDVPPRTVYDAIKRFEETGSNKDRPRSGRPATAVTDENIQLIADKIATAMTTKKATFTANLTPPENWLLNLEFLVSQSAR